MHNFLINSLFIGKNIIVLPMCHSTNEYAETLVQDNNFFEGTTILTYHQTKGKGQRGNSWISEPGKNLTFSIIIKPSFLSINNQFFLNIISSLSVLRVLSTYSPFFKVKWPNDIYWKDEKIGGILIENKLKVPFIETSIVGIGLNINQKDFSGLKATSLANVLHKELDLSSIFPQLLSSFESYYLQLKSGAYEILLRQYLDNLYWFQELHLFKAENIFQGRIIGIDEVGRLKILSEEKKFVFDIKEIQFVE